MARSIPYYALVHARPRSNKATGLPKMECFLAWRQALSQSVYIRLCIRSEPMNPRSAASVRGWASRKRQPKRLCTYRGCKSAHAAHGLCHKHYVWLRQGRIRADSLDNATRTGRPLNGFAWQTLDKACNVCGCPTVFGLCPMCANEVGLCQDCQEGLW